MELTRPLDSIRAAHRSTAAQPILHFSPASAPHVRTCRSRSLLARISSDVDVGAKVTDTDVSDVLPGQVAVNTHAAATVCLVLAILVIPTQVAIQLLSNPNPNPDPLTLTLTVTTTITWRRSRSSSSRTRSCTAGWSE